tara:strand:+ start:159 stop:326 length:168 start_codon:yes stop_codon:yes gene_type:complete
LSERLNVGEQTLRKWRLSGVGPAYIKLGDTKNAKVRYDLSDIQKWELENKFDPSL